MLGLPGGFRAALHRFLGANGRGRAVLALGALEGAAHERIPDQR
jgi:hypothetical protein